MSKTIPCVECLTRVMCIEHIRHSLKRSRVPIERVYIQCAIFDTLLNSNNKHLYCSTLNKYLLDPVCNGFDIRIYHLKRMKRAISYYKNYVIKNKE